MIDYVTVVCGKRLILNTWLKYLLSLPTHKYPGNLIVVNNTDDTFIVDDGLLKLMDKIEIKERKP
tara:strand:- start:878 stop:1072 length:195 start_codon:yes stop_codon:yes gene_type:complete